ncbi:MAG: OmpA family protein [Chitinophagaceae bacterium]|nr:OmpA family protein [Chitinophagaceae bacterium]
MKKILALLLALSAMIPSSFGQDDQIRPAAVGISFFLNDFVTPNRIRTTSLSRVLADKQWAKTADMSPGIAVSYFKGLKKHVDFAGTLAGSFVRYPFPDRPMGSSDRFLLAADAAANIKMFPEKFWFTPYFIAGIGGHMYGGKYFGAFIPLGLGLKVNFFDDAHLFVNSQYRVPVTTETANYQFFNQIGIAGRIGQKKAPVVIVPPTPVLDTDKDGIVDTADKCPTVPGLAKYQGCPIPDTDKDGLNDEEDKCPTVFGLARYQGCPIPDTDKDGINDEEDKCPTTPGLARYQGCPLVDTDNDGVPDEEDKCPTVPGPKENFGCPNIEAEVTKRVDYAANNIYFATGKFVLLARSFKGLDEVAKILKENPALKMSIDGHTDNVGSDANNQKLSENRANSVKNYLVRKGVAADRLTSTGYGETTPIADNKTAGGRQTNRRVEMKLNY